MIRSLAVLFIFVFVVIPVFASPFEYGTLSNGYKYVKHSHSESSYQHAWCTSHNGVEEYKNKDKTRVDCLTTTHAVEFDFSNKWHECVGQALHYGIMTNRKPMCVLILDAKYKKQQMVYYNRIKRIGQVYNVDVEYISVEMLNLDSQNHCKYTDCKCYKK